MRLFRRRIIPNEIVPLDKDDVVYRDDSRIITKWLCIRKRSDMHHGISCYFLDRGYKVSKIFDHDGNLVYWYCDIICYKYEQEDDSYIVTDLLADVIVYPDGTVKVVDLDELGEILLTESLPKEKIAQSLKQLNDLLTVIYDGKFNTITELIEMWE